jgi:hypothetical protein
MFEPLSYTACTAVVLTHQVPEQMYYVGTPAEAYKWN